MTWQPIATAPRDGTAILLAGGSLNRSDYRLIYWSDDKSVEHVDWGEDDFPEDQLTLPVRGRWLKDPWNGNTGCWFVAGYDSGVCGIAYASPTHWMPLPVFP